MSKRILTDEIGSQLTDNYKNEIRLYGTRYPNDIDQYAVIIADDNTFEGL